MRRSGYGLMLLVALAGCDRLPGTVPTPGVRVAEPGEVTACRLISRYTNTPGVYGVLARTGVAYARQGILEAVALTEANTVVFGPAPAGAPVAEITAVSYRC